MTHGSKRNSQCLNADASQRFNVQEGKITHCYYLLIIQNTLLTMSDA